MNADPPTLPATPSAVSLIDASIGSKKRKAIEEPDFTPNSKKSAPAPPNGSSSSSPKSYHSLCDTDHSSTEPCGATPPTSDDSGDETFDDLGTGLTRRTHLGSSVRALIASRRTPDERAERFMKFWDEAFSSVVETRSKAYHGVQDDGDRYNQLFSEVMDRQNSQRDLEYAQQMESSELAGNALAPALAGSQPTHLRSSEQVSLAELKSPAAFAERMSKILSSKTYSPPGSPTHPSTPQTPTHDDELLFSAEKKAKEAVLEVTLAKLDKFFNLLWTASQSVYCTDEETITLFEASINKYLGTHSGSDANAGEDEGETSDRIERVANGDEVESNAMDVDEAQEEEDAQLIHPSRKQEEPEKEEEEEKEEESIPAEKNDDLPESEPSEFAEDELEAALRASKEEEEQMKRAREKEAEELQRVMQASLEEQQVPEVQEAQASMQVSESRDIFGKELDEEQEAPEIESSNSNTEIAPEFEDAGRLEPSTSLPNCVASSIPVADPLSAVQPQNREISNGRELVVPSALGVELAPVKQNEEEDKALVKKREGPSKKNARWTNEEEEILLEVMRDYLKDNPNRSYHWDDIALRMPTRTPHSISQRYHALRLRELAPFDPRKITPTTGIARNPGPSPQEAPIPPIVSSAKTPSKAVAANSFDPSKVIRTTFRPTAAPLVIPLSVIRTLPESHPLRQATAAAPETTNPTIPLSSALPAPAPAPSQPHPPPLVLINPLPPPIDPSKLRFTAQDELLGDEFDL